MYVTRWKHVQVKPVFKKSKCNWSELYNYSKVTVCNLFDSQVTLLILRLELWRGSREEQNNLCFT